MKGLPSYIQDRQNKYQSEMYVSTITMFSPYLRFRAIIKSQFNFE